MSYEVRAAPPEHYEWLVKRTGLYPTAGLRAIEAVDGSGNIRGMIGYDGWMNNSCFMHVALDCAPVFRRLVKPAFTYPFVQAGLSLVLGLTRSGNARAVNNALNLGFKETHRIKDGWDEGEDLILFEMRKADCKWIEGES